MSGSALGFIAQQHEQLSVHRSYWARAREGRAAKHEMLAICRYSRAEIGQGVAFGDRRLRRLCLISTVVLAACSRPPELPTAWTRADGQPVVSGLLDIATLDCKDEMKSADADKDRDKDKSGDSHAIVDRYVGCMREHGYVQLKS